MVSTASLGSLISRQDSKNICLATGAPYFPVRKKAFRQVTVTEDLGYYPELEGLPALREAVAEFQSCDLGLEMDAENVLITYGGMQGAALVCSHVLAEGGEALLPAPYWFQFPHIVGNTNGKLRVVRTRRDDDYKLTPQALRAHLNQQTRLLILTNPNNPTGSLYSMEELTALAEVLRDWPEVRILADQVYNGLVLDGPNYRPGPAHIAELTSRTYTVDSMSKSFAMPGLRVGYIAAPADEIAILAQRQRFATLGVNYGLQRAALNTLANRAEIVSDMVAMSRCRRDLAFCYLDSIPHMQLSAPPAGYYFFVDMSHWIGARAPDGRVIADDESLTRWLAEAAAVDVVAGATCGYAGHIRLTFAVPPASFRDGISRLARGLALLDTHSCAA